ncbi:MAG: hypothetical protein KC900_14390 [Candidatus Omnitrophica bacterium]|nr:hypothetical protein [Candidatus Omnitrophota bacterium]
MGSLEEVSGGRSSGEMDIQEHMIKTRQTAQTPIKLLISLLTLCGCAIFVFWMATGAYVAKQTADDSARIAKLKTVSAALETFREVNTEYPVALGALLKEGAVPPLLSRQSLDQPGYTYEYNPSPDNFALHLKPETGAGAYYYTDKSGDVRVSLNAPAGATSPLWSK